jgi:iron complex outermembrane receptor protein
MSVAVFNTEFDDLPYQVSRVSEGGFDTANLVVEQTSRGIELDTTLNYGNFSMMTSIGYMDVDVEEQAGFSPVAPLTPDLTLAIGPQYTFELDGGDSIRVRADYSYRSEMYGEPTSAPERMTELDSRELVNFDIAYTPANEAYTVALYGRNIFDERYDNARLNTGDYILQILSNDASEFGVRFSTEF